MGRRRHKKGRIVDPISRAKKKARAKKRNAERLAEYEDRSGGYQGSEPHVTGRNLDGPMG